MIYTVVFAGISLRISFQFGSTAEGFREFISAVDEENSKLDIQAEKSDLVREADLFGMPLDHIVEKYYLIGLVTHALLPYNRFCYHGVAFIWKESAWIITAPSGTGKTTQYRHWKELYGDEIELINGDKPIVECRRPGDIWVWPSPWNGKEGYAGRKEGCLAGIILLEQSDHNEMERIGPDRSAKPLLRQILSFFRDTEEIEAAGRMADVMIRSVPVWKLKNLGDRASAEMAHDTLSSYLAGGNDEHISDT